ncbi:hypothetical protein LTR09_006573 [Extremus antarcticus]|uniref:Transcription factor domain-containing protein n=1 Tax=Extremus antarcticus TaxID=702011 RepID=A0AAJ0DEA9_9PEZI|nr:hypothetical protein LTR09_006573 [Extremus antarcticus]
MSSDCGVLMARLIKTVSRLVTSDDELVRSIEGIECIMIESMLSNNAGDLRRAWLANRRAMNIAQTLGLHVKFPLTAKYLEANTLDRINIRYMWDRLVLSDRYLSLVLGLPQGYVEDLSQPQVCLATKCIACASGLEVDDCVDCTERMERILSVVAGLIVQRNDTNRTDTKATRVIDRMLQDGAALMPPKWWAVAHEPTEPGGDNQKAFRKVLRLTILFAYHHLLVQLHLPFMVLPSTESQPGYSKMTASIAARAVVNRYVSYRNSAASRSYCRGIDIIAFVASTTLCLAHINSSPKCGDNFGTALTVWDTLQHQRLSDRGLLELTFSFLHMLAREHQDATSRDICRILEPLLAFERASAGGESYIISAVAKKTGKDTQDVEDVDASSDELFITLPHTANTKIERCTIHMDLFDLAAWPIGDSPLPLYEADSYEPGAGSALNDLIAQDGSALSGRYTSTQPVDIPRTGAELSSWTFDDLFNGEADQRFDKI